MKPKNFLNLPKKMKKHKTTHKLQIKEAEQTQREKIPINPQPQKLNTKKKNTKNLKAAREKQRQTSMKNTIQITEFISRNCGSQSKLHIF